MADNLSMAGGVSRKLGPAELIETAIVGPIPQPEGPPSAAQQEIELRAPRQKRVRTTPPIGRRGFLDPAHLPLTAATASIAGANLGSSPMKGAKLFTASTLEAALKSGDLSKVDPALPMATWPLVQLLATALEPEGPLGSRGPLSSRGPLGRHAWNPSELFRAFGSCDSFSRFLTSIGGPGSAFGPLGNFGADARWIKALFPLTQSIFRILGPDGPLGPKGPLGYLGATGGHGFAQAENGHFVSQRGVERNTDVEYLGGKRSLQLVELYPENDAANLTKQDVSWIADGRIDATDPEDSFKFSVQKNKPFSLTVVPERLGDIFTLELLDKRGRTIATSDSKRFVNFIELTPPASGRYTARVTLRSSTETEPLNKYPVAAMIDAMLKPFFGEEITKRPPGAYRLVCAPGS